MTELTLMDIAKEEAENKGVNRQGVVHPLSASADREAEERDR